MGWDAYFRSGFHPYGAFFGIGKEQERKNCHKVYLGRVALAMRRKKYLGEQLVLLLETATKKALSASAFSSSLVTRFPPTSNKI